MITIKAVKIINNKNNDKSMDFFLTCISKEKLARINRMRFEADKRRVLYADILCRYVLCLNLNMKNSEIFFLSNKYGKPYIKEDISFNNSHSGDWVITCASANNLGIDVEKKKDIDMMIAKRFFHKEECKKVLESSDKKKIFFDYWTKKESFIKAVGKGLSISMDSFKVSLTSYEPVVWDGKKTDYFTDNFFLDNGYSAAICAKDINLGNKDIEIITQDELYKRFISFV